MVQSICVVYDIILCDFVDGECLILSRVGVAIALHTFTTRDYR
jgi:hypothetical protein